MKSQSLHQANAKEPDNYKGYKRIFALCLKISTLVTEQIHNNSNNNAKFLSKVHEYLIRKAMKSIWKSLKGSRGHVIKE